MGRRLNFITLFTYQTMSQPTPSTTTQPVLIVSDGEQGNKMIKIDPAPIATPPEPPVQAEPLPAQSDRATNPQGDVVSSDQHE